MRLISIAAIGVLVASTVACGGGGGGESGDSYLDCTSSELFCSFVPGIATDPPAAPTPVPVCRFPNGSTPQQIYPAPNATGVSTALALYVVADTSAAGYTTADWTVSFSTDPKADGNAAFPRELDHFRPIPVEHIPSPSATALAQNTAFLGATLNPVDVLNGTLLPQTTFYAYMWPLHGSPLAGDDCIPNGPIGSFTTGAS